ncbi:MAG: CRTAC1 family protein [Holophagales bacterium]|nr:CRTAC1 family protein [Holophagales bacterium]MYF95449.1 CRTAC1 family protein [Holophagales bacterium]
MRAHTAGIAVAVAVAVLSGTARAGEREVLFTDATRNAGLDFEHWNGMSGQLYYPEVVGAGAALFDYDNDGDLDLYLVQGSFLGNEGDRTSATTPWTGDWPPRDRLYRNDLELRDDGAIVRFVDVTEESGIVAAGYGMGVVAADLDNDGWVDLYVLNLGVNQLWRNEGDGTFSDRTEASGTGDPRWSVAAAAADYDGDLDLDLFIVNYLNFSLATHKTCLTERGEVDYCLPSAYQPAPDGLLVNDGSGRFDDASVRAGLTAARPGNGLGILAADLDGDRRLDFYVANDLMPNHLWLNGGNGELIEEGLISGAALNADGEAEASMGVAAGDYDGDGDLDLFLTHFHRETNTLYRNDSQPGAVQFRDRTNATGLGRPSWDATSFGTAFVDIDSDGWLDLAAVNGAVTFAAGRPRTEDDPFPLDQPNQAFLNVAGGGGGRRFEPAPTGLLDGATPFVSRGLAAGDIDNDGDTDLVITNNNGPARLLLNRADADTGWFGVAPVLDTSRGRRPASGVTVRVHRTGATPLVRVAGGGGSYASWGDPRVAVPAGDTRVGRIEVQWTDGAVEEWPAPPLRAYTPLVRGTGERRDEREDDAP